MLPFTWQRWNVVSLLTRHFLQFYIFGNQADMLHEMRSWGIGFYFPKLTFKTYKS